LSKLVCLLGGILLHLLRSPFDAVDGSSTGT
jgi:hypothetical protein